MLILHDYWRSSAAYRLRIALNLKGVQYSQISHDLRTGAQRAPDYLAQNPQGLVPALDTPDGIITQSMAAMEWLEERHPQPALLPADAAGRAVVRAMAQIVCSDIHPINNLRVLNWLRSDGGLDPPAVQRWIGHWIGEGFAALETLIARHGGQLAYGDQPTMADCCLVPQLYNARRFNVAVDAYPALVAVTDRAAGLPAFARAAPECQPDAG